MLIITRLLQCCDGNPCRFRASNRICPLSSCLGEIIVHHAKCLESDEFLCNVVCLSASRSNEYDKPREKCEIRCYWTTVRRMLSSKAKHRLEGSAFHRYFSNIDKMRNREIHPNRLSKLLNVEKCIKNLL